MNPNDTILLGVKNRVALIEKASGAILWSTRLPGGMGKDFVTVTSDGKQVFAHTQGLLHCLDFETGRLLWTNELKGYGYGIASICIPGQFTAPELAMVARIFADEQARQSANAAGTPH
jgi:outer membrane protein assembly factor BamB